MDPMTIAALMSAAGSVLNGAKATPAAPAMSTANTVFDGSNWNVNFGSGDISSSAQKAQGDKSSEWLILAIVLVGGVVALKFFKK